VAPATIGDVAAGAGDGVPAVVKLINRYAELLDSGDLDGVADLFSRAAWSSSLGGAPLVGRDQVRRAYDRVKLYDGRPLTRHLMSNVVVDLDTDGRSARSRCYFTVLQQPPGRPPRIVLAGRYHDRFELSGPSWHFAERVIHADLIGDLSLHYG
jgi:3-phenylpropionate/cinnamic acid dioxygenase small subunit